MQGRISLVCAVIITAFLELSAAAGPRQLPASQSGPIKIGVLATFSGDFAPFGELVRSGVQSGAAPGVEFVYEDEGCLPAKAVSAFHKLADLDHISFFIGPVCGSSQQAVAPLLKSRELLAVFPTSAPRSLFAESGARAFSAQYSIERESAFNAGAVYALGHKTAAIFATASEFSRAHETAFRAKYKGTVVESLTFPRMDKETVRAGVLKLKKLNPEALYVPDASPFFFGLKTQLNQMGMEKLPVFSVYSAQSADLLTAEGSAANGLIYSYPAIGEKNAIDYFPKVASELLTQAVAACKGSPVCVKFRLKTSGDFDEDGTLQGAIELRTVKDGKFGATVPIPGL